MENHISPYSPEGGRVKLYDLPNEILLQIFSSIDLHREARILGYIPDDPLPPHAEHLLLEDFRVNNLLNVALTCKRFAALVPEIQLKAIVLEATTSFSNSEPPHSGPFALIRQLSAKPELGRHIKQLRIHLPYKDENIALEYKHKGVAKVVGSLHLPSALKIKVYKDITTSFGRGSFSTLLAILQLEVLCIWEPLHEVDFEWMKQFTNGSFTPQSIQSLRYLKIECRKPLRIRCPGIFQKLETLDLSMRMRGQSPLEIIDASQEFLESTKVEDFHKIKHLRLDFEVRAVGVWNSAGRTCMSNVVFGFPHLESLSYYAEASISKNPYRSVRAFPAYQANIQTYPEVPPSCSEDAESYWDRAIYDARTEITDYQFLVDNLVHLRPTLKRLQLPGGFWTLPGAVRKPIPRFDKFTRLEKLILPQAALISIKLDNMRFDTVYQGDFELSASVALPVSLQHLTIFDVDESFLESSWLQGLFSEQKSHFQWPDFRTLEILMGPTFSDESLEEVLARQRNAAFWAMVDEATFKVVVGRDELDPSLLPDL